VFIIAENKDILVGDTAFNVMKTDNTRALKTFEKGKTNSFIEFKRTMGTTHSYECSNMNKSFHLKNYLLKFLKN
jgi:molecular chaperone DnaK